MNQKIYTLTEAGSVKELVGGGGTGLAVGDSVGGGATALVVGDPVGGGVTGLVVGDSVGGGVTGLVVGDPVGGGATGLVVGDSVGAALVRDSVWEHISTTPQGSSQHSTPSVLTSHEKKKQYPSDSSQSTRGGQ